MPIRTRIVTGANLIVRLNGRLFGRCQGVGWTSSTPHTRTHTIDIQQPVELAPTMVDITWNLSALKIVGDGGIQGAAIVAQGGKVIREKYFTLQVLERISQRPVFECNFCSVDSESWTVRPKGILLGEVQGGGLAWVNEAS